MPKRKRHHTLGMDRGSTHDPVVDKTQPESKAMMQYGELVTMATIRASELGDSTVSIAYLVGDRDWRRAAMYCQAQLITLNQLAGALSRLISLEPQPVSRTPETIAIDAKDSQPQFKP